LGRFLFAEQGFQHLDRACAAESADRDNTVDVRKSMLFARAACADERADLATKLGWPPADDDRVLLFGLAVSALGSARPVEVLEALLGEEKPAQCELVRKGCQLRPSEG
jgi:hypothetical protein